MVSITTAAT